MHTIDRTTLEVRRLEGEHQAFRASVRGIQAELDRRRQSRDLLGCGETLLAELDAFRDRLIRHFAFEERGWSCPQVSAECEPSTQIWIDTLTRQHGDFRRRIDMLVSALETSLISARSLPASFEGDLSSLLADLTRHEQSESLLFDAADFEEMGGVD